MKSERRATEEEKGPARLYRDTCREEAKKNEIEDSERVVPGRESLYTLWAWCRRAISKELCLID